MLSLRWWYYYQRMETSHPPSRTRLLRAGKTLMAEVGYEHAATAAIARRAATSESQLVRYFGGKAGLLEAVFDDGWQRINARIHGLIDTQQDTRTALTAVLAMFIAAMDDDPDLAQLFLFEARRPRGVHGELKLSQGYLDFLDRMHQLIRRGQGDGTLAPAFSSEVLLSALLGAAEAMVRDRLLGSRRGERTRRSGSEVQRVFDAMLTGFAPVSRSGMLSQS
ncbi:MAG TPA: TetR/AcrR family transcriptional regulator [Gammaproteobacteria bacterium]|nr:TetR/AcrR family transcriptional regulator [Gammaproteobacteria bacterium]